MSDDQEQNQDQAHEGPSSQVSRRNVLATGAVALAGLALGGASAQVRTPAQPATGRANPRGRFAGKVVLITGATSGIGRTTAAEFAREGARVYFCGRRENLGAEVQAEIRAFGGDATYQRADVRQEEDVRNLVEGCLSRYGRLDIAFNNSCP
ncbi:hypothetical protein DAETH_38000 (plasmid) [Deinococcus aetherius]|uniref:Short-chain dehydrogenase/reductase SDR n=1 Tax=Deinococcus aetherius TaxID=200252 RepID=A0ABM8AJ48_9DEIO|nr:hypothetical protein DAETH_38000 [Deinococcus aetherius]